MLEDFCGRAEVPGDDRDEAEWSSVPVDEVRVLVNELMTVRSKMLLHMVPVDILSRLLHTLDHQIHRAEGLSIYSEHVSNFLFFSLYLLSCLQLWGFFHVAVDTWTILSYSLAYNQSYIFSARSIFLWTCKDALMIYFFLLCVKLSRLVL